MELVSRPALDEHSIQEPLSTMPTERSLGRNVWPPTFLVHPFFHPFTFRPLQLVAAEDQMSMDGLKRGSHTLRPAAGLRGCCWSSNAANNPDGGLHEAPPWRRNSGTLGRTRHYQASRREPQCLRTRFLIHSPWLTRVREFRRVTVPHRGEDVNPPRVWAGMVIGVRLSR